MELPELGWNDELRAWVVKVTETYVMCVTPMSYNHRITLSDHRDWRWFVIAGWCYSDRLSAFAAAEVFDPEVDVAPVGYKKIAVDSRHKLYDCPRCYRPTYDLEDHTCPS